LQFNLSLSLSGKYFFLRWHAKKERKGREGFFSKERRLAGFDEWREGSIDEQRKEKKKSS
jgi:hypothetical protein